jgi:ClpP class serine protease
MYKNKIMIQISYKDRSFIVEEMTEEDKEILQAEKPELYNKFEKHFKEEKSKNKSKK